MAKKKMYYSNRDSGMIKEDYSAPSNLPQKSFMKNYPLMDFGGDQSWIDDTLSGTDAQINSDAKGMRKQRPKFKF
jgi:hypothetical protein